MRRTFCLSGVVALALAAGCSSQYSVKIDGDVQGSDKDTPRVVKADVLDGAEARAARTAGGSHLRALPDAKVTISLKFKEKTGASKTLKVDSRTAEFHFEEKGQADAALSGVIVHVEAPGRQTVERAFPHPGEVPFEATFMVVLEEAGPGGSTVTPVDPKPPAPPAGR